MLLFEILKIFKGVEGNKYSISKISGDQNHRNCQEVNFYTEKNWGEF